MATSSSKRLRASLRRNRVEAARFAVSLVKHWHQESGGAGGSALGEEDWQRTRNQTWRSLRVFFCPIDYPGPRMFEVGRHRPIFVAITAIPISIARSTKRSVTSMFLDDIE